MGAAKGDYTTRLNDTPQDTLIGLRRKIEVLKEYLNELGYSDVVDKMKELGI